MNEKHEIYNDAVRIDNEYEKAIKKQFGKRATRWTVNKKDFNEKTREVWQKRLGIMKQLEDSYRAGNQINR